MSPAKPIKIRPLRGLHPLCPHCNSKGRVRTTKPLTSDYTEIYCVCENCATVWKGALEVLSIINPPLTIDGDLPMVLGNLTSLGVKKPQSLPQPTRSTR